MSKASESNRFTVELLPNGLYLVYDRQCQWSLCYRYAKELSCNNVQWQHGGVDSMQARMAVMKFISGGAQ